MPVVVQGERWFPEETNFAAEMPDLWGDWGSSSEVDPLQAVLLHRPGAELSGVNESNYKQFRFRAPVDLGKAQAQHDALAAVYRSHGAQVYYVENQRHDRPNAVFMRDLMFMTPQGAILSRPGIAARRGEERAVAATLASLGVPIAKTVNGTGYFEGACGLWVNPDTVVLGSSSRANAEGIRQVKAELEAQGVANVLTLEIPYGSIHLDGYMNMVDHNKMLAFPWHLSYDIARRLMDMGVELIEAVDIYEVKEQLAVNVVAVAPGKVVMAAGCPNTKALLEKHHVEVIEVDLSELLKAWGSVHCMTAFLKRAPQ